MSLCRHGVLFSHHNVGLKERSVCEAMTRVRMNDVNTIHGMVIASASITRLWRPPTQELNCSVVSG